MILLSLFGCWKDCLVSEMSMSDLQLLPPFFLENEEFNLVAENIKGDQKGENATFKDVVKDVHYMIKHLSNHPMPYYQGPFLNTIKMKMFGKSLRDFTSFKHKESVDCAVWDLDDENRDLKKHTAAKICDAEQLNLAGPASRLNSTIIYNCEKGGCQVRCICVICNNPTLCSTKQSCSEAPCKACKVQCGEHNIGIARMFDEEADLFTVIVRKGEATGQTKLFKRENVKFKKYAHIPKSCQACSKDLFDHQLYHKIFHSRCKFCRDDSCFIENCVTFADVKTTKKDVDTKDEKTCSSCFKVFASKYARKRHEYGAHNNGKVQCSICSRLFQSEITLKKHTEVYHTHLPSSFPCTLCTKILSTEQILRRHVNSVHGEKSIECSKCHKVFSRNNHLLRHLRDVHSIENKLNLKYAQTELLYKFNCLDCDAKFKRLETLKRHVILMHGVPQVYKCKVCAKTFNLDSNRKRHERECKESMPAT